MAEGQNYGGLFCARFSPDGRFIAFGVHSDGQDRIFTIGADGGAPRQLTNGGVRDILPAWSADGQSIYFTSNRSGDFQLWKMPAEGGEATQITRNGAFESYASPDGRMIYYTKARGTIGLWRMGVEGGEEIAVPELSEAGYWRSWTVTHSGLYYVAHGPNPPYQIKFYRFSDGQIKTFTTTDKVPLWNFSGLSVSADEKLILYAQYDQSSSGIILADL